MKINISNATFSSIVGIGQKVRKASKESGEEYLELNRGVNAVTEINLSSIYPTINYNTKDFQVYAPNLGIESFRHAIAREYFPTRFREDNIINNIAITPGGMPAIDLVIQILNVENIIFPKFYWGSYSKMATIRKKRFSFYESLGDIDFSKLNESSCVFICDPNNPTGIKLDDDYLYENIVKINRTGAIVIFDSPYRKLFVEDRIFNAISYLENVIITESFSKWIGLSGLRMGFIYSSNKDFNAELNIRLLYQFNAVSTVPQLLIEKILTTQQGRQALDDFRNETTKHIEMNINYLSEKGLLVKEIYMDKYNDMNKPTGIFAVINKSEDYLFQNKIGAVGLDKFVYHDKDIWSSYSRVCVSVPYEKFVKYLNTI